MYKYMYIYIHAHDIRIAAGGRYNACIKSNRFKIKSTQYSYIYLCMYVNSCERMSAKYI